MEINDKQFVIDNYLTMSVREMIEVTGFTKAKIQAIAYKNRLRKKRAWTQEEEDTIAANRHLPIAKMYKLPIFAGRTYSGFHGKVVRMLSQSRICPKRYRKDGYALKKGKRYKLYDYSHLTPKTKEPKEYGFYDYLPDPDKILNRQRNIQ